MVLIPEQIVRIKKKIEMLEKKNTENAAYYADRNTAGAAKSPNNQVGDMFTEYNLALNDISLKDYREVIQKNAFLYKRDYDRIVCGTRFKYCFVDEPEEIEEGILADTMVGLSSHDGFISINSKLGQAVYDKKDGDVCIYQGAEDFQVIRIVGIDKEKSNYVNFIRDSRSSDRKCVLWKRYAAVKKGEDPEFLATYNCITKSQRELLALEINRLVNILDKNNFNSVKRRIALIKTYLRNREVIDDASCNSIDVGTKFKVKLMMKDGREEIKELEMINLALGDELDCDYVERSSSLGMALFGLTEGEEFVYYAGKLGNISGYVYDLHTEKKDNIQYVRR